MEGCLNLYRRARVLKIASFEGPMILMVGKYTSIYQWHLQHICESYQCCMDHVAVHVKGWAGDDGK